MTRQLKYEYERSTFLQKLPPSRRTLKSIQHVTHLHWMSLTVKVMINFHSTQNYLITFPDQGLTGTLLKVKRKIAVLYTLG